MNNFWENEFVLQTANYSITVLCTLVFLAVFELVTKYNNWEEIKKGNISVAMATGGKIYGITNIFRHSIMHHDTIFVTIGWGFFGFFLMLTGYFIFEFLTPKFKIDEEIKNDNRAVGFIAMIISIGLSYVIGAGIMSIK
ncbi:DUF350 domain-containing protein [Fervidibacillus halotolerans]|uniref:DUF350 domain-containing protein n=1 Tax=Fervidibacillus halotolerans TaxID=2980027 RepID=A0A9E8RZG8_9BACI|nr:DUF350 domain-containing protein [Fervidibacillus halotolerans]WAA11627.1 DUF350 domain-containing protein [Fervidibacillus halotolerans]